ncbi:MAG: hypothetical protein ACRDTR_07870 [Rubrobacter sp.]
MIYGERGYCQALTATRRARQRASTNEDRGVREKDDAGPGRLGGGGAGRGGSGIRLLRLGRAG